MKIIHGRGNVLRAGCSLSLLNLSDTLDYSFVHHDTENRNDSFSTVWDAAMLIPWIPTTNILSQEKSNQTLSCLVAETIDMDSLSL